MKKIVALLGSPRKQGNTGFLLDQVVEGARSAGAEVEVYDANKKNVSGCIACFKCREREEFGCAIEDDGQEFLKAAQQADEVIIATPVYWFGPSAQTKLFIDRFFSFVKLDEDTGTYRSCMKGKGLSLVTTAGGDAFDGADLLVMMMNRVAMFTEMNYRGTIGAYSVEDKDTLEQDSKLIKNARKMGKVLAG